MNVDRVMMRSFALAVDEASSPACGHQTARSSECLVVI